MKKKKRTNGSGVALNPQATGKDWFVARKQTKWFHCRTLVESWRTWMAADLAKALACPEIVKLVKEGLDAFFKEPALQHYRISVAAGYIVTGINLKGDWKPIVESFMVAAKEDRTGN